MTMPRYKTRPWLWCAISLIAFIAIGCIHWVDMKGGNALLGASVLGSLLEVISGDAPLGWLSVLVPELVAWLIVAAGVGWCLQSVVVLLFWRHEKQSV